MGNSYSYQNAIIYSGYGFIGYKTIKMYQEWADMKKELSTDNKSYDEIYKHHCVERTTIEEYNNLRNCEIENDNTIKNLLSLSIRYNDLEFFNKYVHHSDDMHMKLCVNHSRYDMLNHFIKNKATDALVYSAFVNNTKMMKYCIDNGADFKNKEVLALIIQNRSLPAFFLISKKKLLNMSYVYNEK